jgi:hypothetical protein
MQYAKLVTNRCRSHTVCIRFNAEKDELEKEFNAKLKETLVNLRATEAEGQRIAVERDQIRMQVLPTRRPHVVILGILLLHMCPYMLILGYLMFVFLYACT